MHFLKTGFWLIFLSNVSNVLNYSLMILISRQLTKADLSIFTSVTATGIVATSFLSVVPSIYVMIFNDNSLGKDKKNSTIKQLNNWVFITSIAFFGLLCLLSFPLTNMLNIDTPIPMLIYSVCLLHSLFLQVLIGYCQGHHRYEVIQVQVFILTFTKLCVTFTLFKVFGNNVYFAFCAEFIATLASLLFLYKRLDVSIAKVKLKFSMIKKYVKKSVPVGATLFISGALLSSDVVIAKHLFTPDHAGEYSVASNLGKIAFFVSGAISGVVFAITQGELSKGKNTVKVLLLASLAAVVCGSCIVLASILFPEEIILLLFGEKYLSSAEVFQLLSVSMTLLSVNAIIFNYLLAKGEYGYIKYAISVLFIYFIIAVSGKVTSSNELASLVTITMALLLVANIYQAIKVTAKRQVTPTISPK